MAQGTPILDRTVRDMLNKLAAHPGLPIEELTPEIARNNLLRAQAEYGQKPSAELKDWNINTDAGPIQVRTIRPGTSGKCSPVILYFHGAGWVMGDATTHDRLVRELAVGAGATVVFVEYDRAPEHRFPVAIEQAYAATHYVSQHGNEFGIDATRLAVAGDSVGGNMATVVTLLAKKRKGPQIVGQLLFYPVTNANFETDSYQQFASGPWLTRAAMRWFWDQYLPDHNMRKEPPASPLLATLEQLRDLPRALIITAENDVLRDEGEAYGRKLIEAGVEVVATRYNATIHDFMLLNAIATAAPTRAAMAQAVDFLKSVLAPT
ncbi:MAG TPA: alpha/beta hydrolase [Terriglobales bacterium]